MKSLFARRPFALPELFVVVCELLRRFYLLKPAISFLVCPKLSPSHLMICCRIFFGVLLLFRDTIMAPWRHFAGL